MEIYYPENIDQVSVVKDNVKIPLYRLGFAEDSETDIFNNAKNRYTDMTRISYMLQDITKSEDDPESVIIKVVDVDNPDREYGIEVPIQYLSSSFMLSQMVQVPLFCLIPSDDIDMSLGSGPYTMNDIIVTVESPVRKTPEFTKLSKALSSLAEQKSELPKNITITEKEIDEVRSDIVDIITGLLSGSQEALLQAYALHEVLQVNHSLKDDKTTPFTDEEKKAILYKDFIMMIESETHPVDMSSIFVGEEKAKDYIDTINTFESILDQGGLGKVLKRNLNKKPKIILTNDSDNDDYLAFISADIEPESIPAPLYSLLKDVKIDYFWEFPWHSALPEDFDSNGERIGDFLVSTIFVVAVRLARLNAIYEINEDPEYSPMGKIIEGLTSRGESFIWIVRETLKLLSENKDLPLYELLIIPKNEDSDSDLNGPLGFIMHGLGHEIVNLNLPLESFRIALKDEPTVLGFVETVIDAYSNVSEELKALGESACFMRGIVLPNISQNVVMTPEYASELIRALHIIAEISAVKNTDASLSSKEWNDYLKTFYSRMI